MTISDRKKYISDRIAVAENGCWEWSKGLKRGYGRACFGGKEIYAHRFSYETHRGAIPDGLVVMHACDNPKCVNPEHLSVGTQLENIADSRDKGRGGAYWYPGETNPKSILDANGVRRIRALRSEKLTHSMIAATVGCSKSLVAFVLSGRRWSHII